MSLRENGTLNKRKLSLDIESATKAVDLRPVIWTAPTDQPTLRQVKVGFNLNGDSKQRKKKHKKEKKSLGNPVEKTPPVLEPALPFREKYFSWRYAIVFLLQTSFVVAVFMRNNLPMALVCMTHQPSSSSSSSSVLQSASSVSTSAPMTSVPTGSAFTDDMYSEESNVATTEEVTTFEGLKNVTLSSSHEFEWDSQTQGFILTSTLLLSFAGPLLGSALRPWLSNKLILTLGNLGSAIITLLCPAAARLSPYCLAAIRVLLGIFLGMNVPVIGDTLAWWSPQGEKLTMVSFTFIGVNMGGIFASLISGFLCSIRVDNGWPFIFYVFGGASLLWGVAWHCLSSQKPEDHPFASEREKQYIIAHRMGMEESEHKNKEKPPYRKILTSGPVLAFLVTGCCHIWGTNVVFSYMPAFFMDVLGFSVQQTGLLLSILTMFRMFGALIWTAIGNAIASRFSTRFGRKVCLVIGFTLAGLTLIGMSFFGRSQRWFSYGILLVSMMAQSCGSSTLTAVPLDMAPRYAGLLTGMFISVASLVSVSGPLVVSSLTPTGTHAEWQVVWCIMGCVYVLGALVFGCLGSATLQPWAKVHRPSMPEIASPFVAMGRRLTTFMERPLVTPVSPGGSVPAKGDGTVVHFDFSYSVQATASPGVDGDVFIGLSKQANDAKTRDYLDKRNGDTRLPKTVVSEVKNVGGNDGRRDKLGEEWAEKEGLENKAFEDEEDENNNDSACEDGESTDEEYDDIKESRRGRPQRAFSEFGLEVAKLPLSLHKKLQIGQAKLEMQNETNYDENHEEQTQKDIEVIEHPEELHSKAIAGLPTAQEVAESDLNRDPSRSEGENNDQKGIEKFSQAEPDWLDSAMQHDQGTASLPESERETASRPMDVSYPPNTVQPERSFNLTDSISHNGHHSTTERSHGVITKDSTKNSLNSGHFQIQGETKCLAVYNGSEPGGDSNTISIKL